MPEAQRAVGVVGGEFDQRGRHDREYDRPLGARERVPGRSFQGQSTDIEIHARETLAIRRRLDELYAQHTGKTIEQVHDDMERDRFFTPEQARDYGLIDRVIEDRAAAAA